MRRARAATMAAAQVLALEQAPRPQGAIYTFDLSTGYVLAMVGGDDYDRSEFNRVVQACRQPGSAYKPIYYSLALDRGYGFDTAVERQGQGRGRSGHRRAVGAAEHRRQLRAAGDARARAGVVEEPAVGGDLQDRSAPRTSRRGRAARHHHADPRRRRAGARRLVRAHRRAVARLRDVRAQRPRRSRRSTCGACSTARGQVLNDHSAWDDPMLDGGAAARPHRGAWRATQRGR